MECKLDKDKVVWLGNKRRRRMVASCSAYAEQLATYVGYQARALTLGRDPSGVVARQFIDAPALRRSSFLLI